MKEGFVTVDGVRHHFLESGEGVAIVFVHGWGLTLQSWMGQMSVLQDRFRVIAYDWRGHGLSDPTPPYDFSVLARELDGLLDQLDVHSPVLCGHSMGGTIVMDYMTTCTRSLSAVLLVDTNLPGTRWDRFVHWMRCEGSSAATELLGRALGRRRALEVISRVYGYEFWADAWRAGHPQEYAAWRRQFAEGDFSGMINAYRASARRQNPEPAMRALALPALVVNGTADRVFSVKMAKRIAGSIPGARLALVEGAGHMSMCEQPGTVNDYIVDFLRQVLRAA